MSEKKIVVPEGMLEAAMKSSLKVGLPIGPSTEIKVILESALRWLSDNPIIPTMEQALWLRDLAINTSKGYDQVQPTAASECAVVTEWQRRMFLASSQKVPKEIEDLQWSKNLYYGYANFYEAIPKINESIVEAYRRGQNKQQMKQQYHGYHMYKTEISDEVFDMLLDESAPDESRPTRTFFNNEVIKAYKLGQKSKESK